MKSSLKWILKKQLGWIVGAGFILIYTNAFAQTYTDLATPYKYVVPGTEVVSPGQERSSRRINQEIIFKPAANTGRPTLMDQSLQTTSKPVLQPTVVQEQTQSTAGAAKPEPKRARDQVATKPAKTETAQKAAPSQEKQTVTANEPEFLGSPVWGRSKDRDRWSKAVLEVVRANKKTLNGAKDIETFCPGYRKSTARAQDMCWLILMSAISKKESDFNPNTSLTEDNGDVSVGLLAMSGHQCRNAPTIRALKNPIENVKCGTRKMVQLVGKYGFISGGRLGAGANWSVIRERYQARFRGKLRWFGKKHEIVNMTKPKFKAVLRESAQHQEKIRLALAQQQAAQAAALAKIQADSQTETLDNSDRAATGIQ